MKTFCEIFQIDRITFTAFQPQTLGSLEQSHITLIEYLKNFAIKQNWDEWLRYAIFSHNTYVHKYTEFTSHALVFRREARLPTSISDNKVPPTYVEFIKESFLPVSRPLRHRKSSSASRCRNPRDDPSHRFSSSTCCGLALGSPPLCGQSQGRGGTGSPPFSCGLNRRPTRS